MADPAIKNLDKAIDDSIRDFEPGSIVKGKVVNMVGDDVIVDVGYKSEGVVSLARTVLLSGARASILSKAVALS